MRQAGAPRSSACGRSRGLPIEFDEVGEGVPESRGRDDRFERLAASVGEDDLALGQALDGGQDLDAPRAEQEVHQPFVLAGWAADLDAVVGTGIDTLHVWAYPATGGAPVFLGTPALGGARPDVAAIHGDQFTESGFGLTPQGLIPGTYDLAVFPWSNVSGAFAPPKMVHVTVR